MLNLRKIVWHSCSSVTMVVAGGEWRLEGIRVDFFLPAERTLAAII